MNQLPRMFYFGPYARSGHFFFYEDGQEVMRVEREKIEWKDYEVDGTMQPGRVQWRKHWIQKGPMVQGQALLHHRNGWTALSFWDCTIDTRPNCTSTYIAEGMFTFEQMVAMASARFAERWNKMKFKVVLVELKSDHCGQWDTGCGGLGECNCTRDCCRAYCVKI